MNSRVLMLAIRAQSFGFFVEAQRCGRAAQRNGDIIGGGVEQSLWTWRALLPGDMGEARAGKAKVFAWHGGERSHVEFVFRLRVYAGW